MDRTDRERRVVRRWRTRIQSEALGPTLDRAYPTDQAAFDETIKAIDEAKRDVSGIPGSADKTPE